MDGSPLRVHHTDGRDGALAYLAAHDVHAAKVFGSAAPENAPAA